jgi:hypothetical protein
MIDRLVAVALALALFTIFPVHAGRAELQAGSAGEVMTTGYDWVEISGLGTRLELSDWSGDDDEGHASVSLPWAFPWFGNHHSTVYIDANGNVGFEDWPEDTWGGDNRIPGDGAPNNRISAFYEDLAGPEGGTCAVDGGVYTHHDPAQNRFIIQFDQWCSLDDGGINTFQIMLYPDGEVVVQYNTVPSGPPSLSFGNPVGESPVGVESPDGGSGSTWSGGVADGTAWIYRPEFTPIPDFLHKLFVPQVGGE